MLCLPSTNTGAKNFHPFCKKFPSIRGNRVIRLGGWLVKCLAHHSIVSKDLAMLCDWSGRRRSQSFSRRFWWILWSFAGFCSYFISSAMGHICGTDNCLKFNLIDIFSKDCLKKKIIIFQFAPGSPVLSPKWRTTKERQLLFVKLLGSTEAITARWTSMLIEFAMMRRGLLFNRKNSFQVWHW